MLARFALMLAVVAAGLLLAAPAFGWSQVYRGEGWVPPGGIAYSGNNYGLNWNEVWFQPSGYGDLMQLTLCNTTPSCYPYANCASTCADTRSISYGHAKCTAYQYNGNWLYVYHCFTHN